MKKLAVVLSVLAVFGFAATSFADRDQSATAHVRVTVDPNIALKSDTPLVNMGSVQKGDILGNLVFDCQANSQFVSFQVEASALYKGNSPKSPEKSIPVNLSAGANVEIENGNATGGHANNLAFTADTGVVNGFPTTVTELAQWESGIAGHLSQKVSVLVKWLLTENEQPQGEYSGVVKLRGVIL